MAPAQTARRPRAGRGLAATLAAASVAATLRLAPAFASSGDAGRRSLLAGVAGATVAGSAASEAQAQLAPVLPQKKRAVREYTDEERRALIKKRFGFDLDRITELKDNCYWVDEEGKGYTAKVGTDSVIVWDNDWPCPKGQSLILDAGKGRIKPMTAAEGPTKHTYTAATFEFEYVRTYSDKVGQCAPTPTEGEDALTWEVANELRGGKCS